ncbi:MAG: hypothetical protein H2056_06805 [Sphingopyxis sp.]|nr:hypothetical protein [Sphingopyxis sp.]
MTRLALLLLLGAAQPAVAQDACAPIPAVFPFAPPSEPLRFVIETDRPVSTGGTRRFGLEYRMQFHAVGRGHGLTATLLHIHAPDAMAAGNAMAAIFEPLVGRPVEFVYDANAGRLLLRKDVADALWKLLADETVTRAEKAEPGEARSVAAMLLDLPVGQRESTLFGDFGQMLSFAGQSPGSDLMASIPAVDGDCRLVRLTGRSGGTHGGPGFQTDTLWLVDVQTGLVHEQREEVTQVLEASEKPVLAARTVRRLIPE